MIKKFILGSFMALLPLFGISQKRNYKSEYKQFYVDLHNRSKWFREMKVGANYEKVKADYQKYFFENPHRGKTRPKMLGQRWLDEMKFFLDKKGRVQAFPNFVERNNISSSSLLAPMTTRSVGSWNMIGPVNSGDNSNEGGYTFLVRIDPTNNNRMFISFVTGGLWRTIDGGTNWTLVDANLPNDRYLDLDVCNANPNIMYACSNKRVIKSTDGGASWTSTQLVSTDNTSIYDIAVSGNDPNFVVARHGNVLKRTTDGGTTWSTVLTGLGNVWIYDGSISSEILDWKLNSSNEIYFSDIASNTQVKIYKSSDKGATFNPLTTISKNSSANGAAIGWSKILQASNNSNAVYVAFGTGSDPNAHLAVQFYKVDSNSGAILNEKINMVPGTGGMYDNTANILHHGDIAMNRNNENQIAFGSYGGSKVVFSNDGGTTFTVSPYNTHMDQRSLDYVNNVILVGTDGSACVSKDYGTNFSITTRGISNHELWGFGTAWKSDVAGAGLNHGPLAVKEAFNGNEWNNSGGGADQGQTDVNPIDDRYIYTTSIYNTRTFKRTGAVQMSEEPFVIDLGNGRNMEFHPNYTYRLISNHGGRYGSSDANLRSLWSRSLLRSDDNGKTVSVIKTFTNSPTIYRIAYSNPKIMYAVEGNRLWKTIDEGVNWTNITPSSTASSGQTNISDIEVSDTDANQLWISYGGVQSACKVLKSINGGTSYTNITTSKLTTYPITKLEFHRGTNGGVYAATHIGVFYRNNSMTDWVAIGSGLPMMFINHMFVNQAGKLRIGGSRGAWEHATYENPTVSANFAADFTKISCKVVNSNIQFRDNSVVNKNGTHSYNWTFSGGTPSTSTLENPIVSYANAAPGLYSATLTVTDNTGSSTKTLTNFIEVLETCGNATPNLTPGKSFDTSGGNYFKSNGLNFNINSFTFSAWIKPKGIQEDYSALFSSQNEGDSFILNFRGGNNTIGFHPIWWWDSGLKATPDKWSHVAVVSNGSQVKIYLDGKESVLNHAMASKIVDNIDFGRFGRDYYGSRITNLEMDEVCIWNRPLTIEEIRKWRHLTKTYQASTFGISNGLVAYYQFDESADNISLSKTSNGGYAVMNAAKRLTSDAPVFDGVSEKLNITTGGSKNYIEPGVTINFPTTGTVPNGDVWVSRSRSINPDVLPTGNNNFKEYFVINNYGTNSTFSPFTSIQFRNNPLWTSTLANQYTLFKRESNDFGANWVVTSPTANNINSAGTASSSLTFSGNLTLNNTFSQYVIMGNFGTLGTSDVSISESCGIINNLIQRNDVINLQTPKHWGKTKWNLYDMSGKLVIDYLLKSSSEKINVSLPAGVYVSILYDGINQCKSKLVVK